MRLPESSVIRRGDGTPTPAEIHWGTLAFASTDGHVIDVRYVGSVDGPGCTDEAPPDP